MVYCGKASQGCQSCRTRRIKCDKVKPECSQCIRVGKKCPGYRDQLSLMFRDESSKVIQKAHAQWGVTETPGPSSQLVSQRQQQPPHLLASLSPASSAGRSSISSQSSSASGQGPSPPPQPTVGGSEYEGGSPAPLAPAATPYSTSYPNSFPHGFNQGHYHEGVQEYMPHGLPTNLPIGPPLWMPPTIGPTMEEQGVQFYVNHYLLGHPDEPTSATGLKGLKWLFHPALQDVMAAVGLAGLSNLNGDEEMNELSRRKYVSAIRHTGKLLTHPPSAGDAENTLRTVVMLALFEVVKGTHHSADSVNAHIMGAAALLRTMVPDANAPASSLRGLLQLGYSLFIPCHASGTNVPPQVFEAVNFATRGLPEPDRPVGQLGTMASRFLQLSSVTGRTVLTDGRPTTEQLLQQLLDLEEDFEKWEESLPLQWQFESRHNSTLPPSGVFQGQYHVYPDMWMARMWNHYRWARIYTNELILDFVERFPDTSLMLVSAMQRRRCFEVNHRLAEDILVSTPNHWKHPHLDEKAQALVATVGQAGSGAVGVPAMLHHLRAAGCTPGVSREVFEWAYRMVQSIWADMGMLHARIILDMMDTHKAKLAAASN